MADEYYESIKLKLEVNQDELNKLESKFKALTDKGLLGGQSYEEFAKKELEIVKLQKELAVLNEVNIKEAKDAAKGIQDRLKELAGDDSKGGKKPNKFIDGLKSSLVSAFDKFTEDIKQVFKDAWKELQDITQYSFNTDSRIRELKLGYGFSSSEAYGYEQAMGMLGFSSMEDLFYADDSQLGQFKRLFEKYSQYYEETMTPEMVEAQLEYQIAMKEFKQDMKNTVIKFFIDNQDEIISVMNMLMTFMKAGLDVFGWLLNAFSDGTRSEATRNRETASILNKYTSSNSTYNVNTNNTYNGVTTENQQLLTNYGNTAIKNFIESLK